MPHSAQLPNDSWCGCGRYCSASVLRALEKKEQLANHKNLYGWFVNACKLECITLARRSRIERRRLGISLPLEPEILIEKQQDELIQWLRKSEMNELLELSLIHI